MIPEDKANVPCRLCQSSQKTEVRRHDMHYSDIRCLGCGTHLGFGKDPDKLQKRSTKGHAKLVKKYSKGYCVICLRQEQQLPTPEVLEPHHVIQVCDGGGDEESNIQIVCTPCHRWIHHQRTYLGHYHKEAA